MREQAPPGPVGKQLAMALDELPEFAELLDDVPEPAEPLDEVEEPPGPVEELSEPPELLPEPPVRDALELGPFDPQAPVIPTKTHRPTAGAPKRYGIMPPSCGYFVRILIECGRPTSRSRDHALVMRALHSLYPSRTPHRDDQRLFPYSSRISSMRSGPSR
jgi:hypothetical protein